jgi:CheY-like chemotaxis protein
MKIADTGTGLAPEQLKKLFVPFERLGAERSNIEGTGLGLAYSNRFVTAMGGSIGVESEVGKGSVFWIETTLSEAEQQTDRVSAESSGIASSQANLNIGLGHVLCIQDDPVSVQQIEDIFNHLPGYKLVLAERGDIGVQLALEHAPELVLLDLQLPDMDGLEVLKELRKQLSTAQIPIVVVSAGLTEEMKQSALDAGAHSCVAKPIRVRDLLDTIASLI